MITVGIISTKNLPFFLGTVTPHNSKNHPCIPYDQIINSHPFQNDPPQKVFHYHIPNNKTTIPLSTPNPFPLHTPINSPKIRKTTKHSPSADSNNTSSEKKSKPLPNIRDDLGHKNKSKKP